MSEHHDFLSRWSRLKRESESRRKRETELQECAAAPSAAVTSVANEDGAARTETCATPTFDLTSLRPIDSVTADTDICIFLQSGVPAQLTEAALRRAWVSDPVIRDFIGIAENQWDFTNPTTIPGFGPLQETGDELSRLAQMAGIFDKSLDQGAARLADADAFAEKARLAMGDARRNEIQHAAPEAQAPSTMRVVDNETSDATPENGRVDSAVQNCPPPQTTGLRRGRRAHGGALPR